MSAKFVPYSLSNLTARSAESHTNNILITY